MQLCGNTLFLLIIRTHLQQIMFHGKECGIQSLESVFDSVKSRMQDRGPLTPPLSQHYTYFSRWIRKGVDEVT